MADYDTAGGWDTVAIQYFILHAFKYNPLEIKSYLPLPKELQNKKCCINIQNDDDKCFKYCILNIVFYITFIKMN